LKQGIADNLIDNIKKRFLTSTDEKIHQACQKHLQHDNLVFDKINLTLISVYMRNPYALQYAAQKFPPMSTINDETLVQICDKTKDMDCLKIALQSMSQHKSYLNQNTIEILLNLPPSDEQKKVFKDNLIISATLEQSVEQKLEKPGLVKKQYVYGPKKVANSDIINEAIDFGGADNEMKKIKIQTLSYKVSDSINSSQTIRYL